MVEYLLDVRPILDEVGGAVSATDTFALDALVVGDNTFVLREPAYFQVTVSNAGEGLVAIGSVTAPVRATCSRCLVEFDTDITGDIEGFWPRPGGELPEAEEITGTVDAEGRVDLGPVFEAALVAEAPFAPLHDEECAGLCPGCGADLNAEECGCEHASQAAHPFAALKDLVVEDGDETEG
jgi:uncharacterized protein